MASGRIAVTGAGGRVGRAVVAELLAHGYEVVAFTYPYWPECPVDQHVVDLRNENDVGALATELGDCTGLVHLAAIPGPRKHHPAELLRTNLVGTYNILYQGCLSGIRRMAWASSDTTLGFTFSENKPDPVYLPVDEQHPVRPDDSYGLSKILAERSAESLVQRFPGLSVASLRITGIVTPERYAKGSKWLTNLLKSQFSNNLWSYLDVRDAGRAFRMAVETDLGGHEIFFIGADTTRSLTPSAELARTYYPDVPWKHELTRHESLESHEKARRKLGFHPEHDWRNHVTPDDLGLGERELELMKQAGAW
jgi:nucleoside-diphosphate-sugar epimerase